MLLKKKFMAIRVRGCNLLGLLTRRATFAARARIVTHAEKQAIAELQIYSTRFETRFFSFFSPSTPRYHEMTRLPG